MKTLVLASMMNEGAFIVEWVTWYRMLGFTDILIVTNDCTDRSPALLDALAAAGWVTHLPHVLPPDAIPLRAKLRRAARHPLVTGADWIFVCDCDEFLVIHEGEGRITDLLPADAPFLGMAVNWRVFGTSGRAQHESGLVHRQFTRCAWRSHPASAWVKSIFRRPELFAALDAHGPQGYKGDALPSERFWVNSDGAGLPNFTKGGPYQRHTAEGMQAFARAQLNHYMIRSDENFALKRGTLSPAALKDRYTDKFYARYNRNEGEDLSALRHAARFDALHAQAMALPGVRALHHLCCADYIARLAARAGRRPEEDARWRQEIAAATAADRDGDAAPPR
ncbi:glycosyltransferase family 2 protein [Frigidibacter sp. MR17.14]|uniref:glycosyltransferase family 2 protein n=1 Tax=Frigidibacter sp. MR17.14 TaxID=3126509 RepID=UPI003012CDFC